MTKANLAEQLATSTELTKKDAEKIVDAVFAAVGKALQSGERVDIRGFGSFKIKNQPARQARNPRTGEMIDVAAKNVATFKSGKELAELVNSTPAAA